MNVLKIAKKISFILIMVCFVKNSVAQTIPIVQAYNVLGTRDVAPYQLKYDIVHDKPLWKAINVDDATDVTLYIAPKGNYLEIKDAGSGGNKTTVQCRIIQSKKDKTIIVLNTTVYINEQEKLNSIHFYEVDEFGGEQLKNIMPKINPLQFIAKADLAVQDELFTNGEVLYKLNEANSNIEASAYYKKLEKDCMTGSKSACQAQNVIQPPLTLVWINSLKKYVKAQKK